MSWLSWNGLGAVGYDWAGLGSTLLGWAIGRIFSYIFFSDIGKRIKILPIRDLPIFLIFKKLAIFQLPIH